MPTYNIEDYKNAVRGKNISQADYQLGLKNPDVGMSLLNYQADWRNARTQQEREAANQAANALRSQYGHYTGGQDGSKFYQDKPSPGSFAEPEKPQFSYNLETDPVYSAYKKQYAREGQRATANALGNAAAATGGIPSSYAATAVSQAGDYYAAQLSDKVPELYQQAYNRHLNDLSQYNTDRNFRYGQYLDEINAKTADRQEAMQNALYGLQVGDYKGMKDLGYDVSNTPEAYQKQVTNAEMMYNLALAQAKLGDYSYLNRLTGKYF